MREQVLKARSDWYEAFMRGDFRALELLEADDFVSISEEGFQNKDLRLKLMREAVINGAWPSGAGHIDDKELKILNQGEIFVIYCQSQVTLAGKKFPPMYVSEVWRKVSNGWRIVCYHGTKIKNS